MWLEVTDVPVRALDASMIQRGPRVVHAIVSNVFLGQVEAEAVGVLAKLMQLFVLVF